MSSRTAPRGRAIRVLGGAAPQNVGMAGGVAAQGATQASQPRVEGVHTPGVERVHVGAQHVGGAARPEIQQRGRR